MNGENIKLVDSTNPNWNSLLKFNILLTRQPAITRRTYLSISTIFKFVFPNLLIPSTHEHQLVSIPSTNFSETSGIDSSEVLRELWFSRNKEWDTCSQQVGRIQSHFSSGVFEHVICLADKFSRTISEIRSIFLLCQQTISIGMFVYIFTQILPRSIKRKHRWRSWKLRVLCLFCGCSIPELFNGSLRDATPETRITIDVRLGLSSITIFKLAYFQILIKFSMLEIVYIIFRIHFSNILLSL